MRGAVHGVTPLRSIRMHEPAYNFSAHFRVKRGDNDCQYTIHNAELVSPAVSALGVRSWKLSNALNGQSWDG
jgi:hypothetical protein